MAKGPRGERRPADVIGCAVTVAKIATVEIEDMRLKQSAKRKNGLARAEARSVGVALKERSETPCAAANTRWR